MSGQGFWMLSAGYASVPLLLGIAHVVIDEEPGPLLYAFGGFSLTLAVIFFGMGCLAEAL